ncbi:cobalamin biosynthesis protein [Sphingomonas sanguinis]|uniref:cobalamin biosynthesis protein n=1 Tax=Sphingomonas sp. LC-1 TaxID=3110957 RepID=UPI0021BB6468|nr:cobalamin biosynthesis protein [Sphingomonas sp. LC-1]MCT8002517.1 cobalamin biosynthesis protein [Sphingomonas sp. LC-1]
MVIAGFGCRAGATHESFRSALAVAGVHPDALAVPADRAAAIAGFALAEGLSVRPIPVDSLHGIDTPTRSAASLAYRGVGSVAEAAALAAAGPGARIIVPRVTSSDRMATCAIAQGQ